MADLEQRIMQGEIRASQAEGVAHFATLPFSSADVRREIRRTKNSRTRKIVIAVAIATLIVAAIAVCNIMRIPDHVFAVETGAMEPAIAQNQSVYVNDDLTPHAGDVIMYRTLSNEVQFKRIIACPGEWIGITDDNQIALSDKAIAQGAIVQRDGSDAIIVASSFMPEYTYFLLGDAEPVTPEALENPDNFVLVEQMKGIATFKVWPFPNIGRIE